MIKRNVFISSVLAVLLGSASVAGAYTENNLMTDDAIRDRVKPFGSIIIGGSASGEPQGPRSGEEVYKSTCTNCHDSGALNSPKLGDAAAWGPRAAQGMDTLLGHALGGLNSMPARGLCMDCSDDEIKAAIQYMLDNSL